MGNDSGSGSGSIVTLAVGVILGGFLVYVITQSRQQTAAPPPAAAQAASPSPATLALPHISAEIERLNAEIAKLHHENAELRMQLQIAAPQGRVIPESKPAPPAATATAKPTPTPAIYKNSEKWLIERGGDGNT